MAMLTFFFFPHTCFPQVDSDLAINPYLVVSVEKTSERDISNDAQ